MFRFILLTILLTIISDESKCQEDIFPIQCGADQTATLEQLIRGKRVAVMANQTSMVGTHHLVDTLLSLGIDTRKIFAAEHGFRGKEADGALIPDGIDPVTGLPLISLYGKNHKPAPDDLKDVDVVVFDIQDIGVRFYTFISSMHYMMEACAEAGKEFLVLDRPNPNGNYIDGPILEKGYESFVGMDPVPVVHGMTVAEYARMINGEGWLKDSIQCRLSWIPCKNYKHSSEYNPPITPSPNLPNLQAIRLYPSLAFFEGTIVSEGRGTDFPFQVFGFPGFPGGDIEFTPRSCTASLHPKFENLSCSGRDLRHYIQPQAQWKEINLDWLIEAYNAYDEKEKFFVPYFDLLAGTDQLRKDIQAGLNSPEIKQKWQRGLKKFRNTRAKYLIYEEK
jgi:uncharacterized protein YbbC (DUF1343 family)